MRILVPLVFVLLFASSTAMALEIGVPNLGPGPGSAPGPGNDDVGAPVLSLPDAGFADAAPPGEGYHISFACPAAVGAVASPLKTDPQPCPNRIVDADDTLGNPSLAVDPVVPGRYAFASLHGQPARGKPPTALAREGQTHTTFSTLAVGAQWVDQPYSPPQDAFPDGQNIMGLDDAAVIDQTRTLHIAALYAWNPRSESNVVNYTIVLWKFAQETRDRTGGTGGGLSQADYELVSATFSNKLPGSVIDDLWFVEDDKLGTLYLFWHEHAAANSTLNVPGVGNVTSWIAGALTAADPVTPWGRLPPALLIAPCAVASNPVLVDGRVTFACGAGAKGEPLLGLAPGEMVLRAVDPAITEVANEGKAPLASGSPKLVVSKRGDVTLLTARVVYENGTTPPNVSHNDSAGPVNVGNRTRVIAQLATRDASGDWGRVHDFGADIHNTTRMVRTARFTAAYYSDQTDTVHLVYLEDTLSTDRNVTRWTKQLLVIDRVGGVVLNMDLHLRPRAEAGRVPASSSDAYADTRDSLIRVSGKEYIAFNDYAVVVFAQVVEKDDRIQPIVQQSLPPVPEPLPVVQATGIATATGIGLGATAAVGAGAMVARRVANAAGAGRRKR